MPKLNKNNQSTKLFKSTLLLTAGLLLSTPAIAEDNHRGHHARADGHAPIGVMGDHVHKAGEFMISLRTMYMSMDGNRDGTSDLSDNQITSTGLRIAPQQMDMHMHMFGIMFGLTDDLTFMGMTSIKRNDMDLNTYAMMDPGTQLGTFNTVSDGMGDTSFGLLYRLYKDHSNEWIGGFAVSAPTGSTIRRDTILAPNGMTPEVRLPYAMQLGTGTWDLIPSLTYKGRAGDLSWGAQYKGRFHTGTNDEGYTRGDKHELTAWAAYQWAPWVSTSLRVKGTTEQDIDGSDALIAGPVQTADPSNYGGERIDVLAGINFMGQPGSIFKGQRLSFEAGLPVYESLNGPQMSQEFTFMGSWMASF